MTASTEYCLEQSFDAALRRLLGASLRPRLLVGCSGGADSLALTLLTQRFLQRYGGNLHVAVVDHRLRSASSDEAHRTACWLASQGIRHQILSVHATPQGNLQAFARTQRYALLERYAHSIKANAVLLGHHQGDQAETVLDHLARGSHALGLCGMAPQATYQKTTLLRPLLDCAAKDIRTYAENHHAPIIDDPSNNDPRFRRVQLRRWLAHNPHLEILALEIAKHARFHAGVELAASRALLCDSLHHITSDALELRLAPWHDAPLAVQQRTLGALIRHLSGRAYPPRAHKLQRACAWLQTPNCPQISLAHVVLRHDIDFLKLHHESGMPASHNTSPGSDLSRPDLFFAKLHPIYTLRCNPTAAPPSKNNPSSALQKTQSI